MQLSWLYCLGGLLCSKVFDDTGPPTKSVNLQDTTIPPVTVTVTVGIVATPVTNTYVPPPPVSATPRATPKVYRCDPSTCPPISTPWSLATEFSEFGQRVLETVDTIKNIGHYLDAAAHFGYVTACDIVEFDYNIARGAYKFITGQKLVINFKFTAAQLLAATLFCFLFLGMWQCVFDPGLNQHIKHVGKTVCKGIYSGSLVFWTVVSSLMMFLVYDELKQDPVKHCLSVLFFSLPGDNPVMQFLRDVGFGFKSLRQSTEDAITRRHLSGGCLNAEFFGLIDQLQDNGTFVPKNFTEIGVGILVGLWRFCRATPGFLIDLWTCENSKLKLVCYWIGRQLLRVYTTRKNALLWCFNVALPSITAFIVDLYTFYRLGFMMWLARYGKAPWLERGSAKYAEQSEALYELSRMNAFQMADIIVENNWFRKDKTVMDVDRNIYWEIYNHARCHMDWWREYSDVTSIFKQRMHEKQPRELKLDFFPWRCPFAH